MSSNQPVRPVREARRWSFESCCRKPEDRCRSFFVSIVAETCKSVSFGSRVRQAHLILGPNIESTVLHKIICAAFVTQQIVNPYSDFFTQNVAHARSDGVAFRGSRLHADSLAPVICVKYRFSPSRIRFVSSGGVAECAGSPMRGPNSPFIRQKEVLREPKRTKGSRLRLRVSAKLTGAMDAEINAGRWPHAPSVVRGPDCQGSRRY